MAEQLLLIVRAEREDMLAAFAGTLGVVGLIDRRKGDRRLQPRPRIPTERRHDDRRIRPWATLALEAQGLVLVRTAQREAAVEETGPVPFKARDRVRVLDGQFKGWLGEVVAVDEASRRVTVVIAVLGKGTQIEFAPSQLALGAWRRPDA
jgi:transcription antitermination factor NusG